MKYEYTIFLIVTKIYTRVPRVIVYFSSFSVVFSIKKNILRSWHPYLNEISVILFLFLSFRVIRILTVMEESLFRVLRDLIMLKVSAHILSYSLEQISYSVITNAFTHINML